MPIAKPVDPLFGPPKGINNFYGNVPLDKLQAWIAKDPICQYFAKLKSENLERELTALKVEKILRLKKEKKLLEKASRTKSHNEIPKKFQRRK